MRLPRIRFTLKRIAIIVLYAAILSFGVRLMSDGLRHVRQFGPRHDMYMRYMFGWFVTFFTILYGTGFLTRSAQRKRKTG
jgi:hypothetical protein